MDDEPTYLTSADLRKRYGRTDMTIHRWLNNPEMGFPRPIYLARRRYWRIEDLEAWEHDQAKKADGKYAAAVDEAA